MGHLESISGKNPVARQVLANIGNRYVVFGTRNVLPNQPVLGPSDVGKRFSERVGDEYEFPEKRLIESLQVSGTEVFETQGPDGGWDIEVIFPDSSKLIVQIAIRTRDKSSREIKADFEALRNQDQNHHQKFEIWLFNIERLRLQILHKDDHDRVVFTELEPLNIWEFNADGTSFERSYVLDRVTEWANRIDKVYSEIKGWADSLHITSDTSRTVLMSEDLMHKFAVPDRELPVLDLIKGSEPLLSFVPAGLWLIGANGRVDIISKHGSTLLVGLPGSEIPKWHVVVSKQQRKFEEWNKDSFQRIVEAAQEP